MPLLGDCLQVVMLYTSYISPIYWHVMSFLTCACFYICLCICLAVLIYTAHVQTWQDTVHGIYKSLVRDTLLSATTKPFVPSIWGRLHEPKRITADRAHRSAFSTHSYQAICLHLDLQPLYLFVLPPSMFSSVSPALFNLP